MATKKKQARKTKASKKKASKPARRVKRLKGEDIRSSAARIIALPPAKDSDKADGTDKKTDPKTDKKADSDFRNHGDPKR